MSTLFPQRLLRQVETQPNEPCLHFLQAGKPDRSISYHSFYSQAAVFAEKLRQEGIQPGEVVVLIINYRTELLYGFWGAILHGAIPSILPFLTEKLNPDRYLADLTSLIEVTRPAAILTYADFEEIVQAAAQPDSSVRTIIYLEDIQGHQPPDQTDFSGFSREPEDIVLLQHSSGTTGLQKGVALSHQAVFNQIQALSNSISLNSQSDVIVSWLPLYHDMGLIAGFLLPILTGIPLVLLSPFDWVRAPYRLLQAVSDYQGTLTWLPNFAYNFCAQKIRSRHLEGIDLSHWRAVINCSEPVRWESHRVFYDRFKDQGLSWDSLQTSYAMAENTFGVTQSELGVGPAIQYIDRNKYQEENLIVPVQQNESSLVMMSSGKTLKNTEVRILGPGGQLLKENCIGEIALRSNSMLTEYYRRPDITNSSFQEGWFLTGDYGFQAGGEIFVTGRKKDIIIVGGKNIYPGDLEELLNDLPGVHPGRLVVFGVYNENLGTEDVVAVAESDRQDPQYRQQLADRIRARITRNSPISLRYVKITDPKWIIKTSSGKVSRSANKEKYLAEKNLS